MWKKWWLWMPICYSFLALMSTNDETLIAFFLITPPAWLTETHWFVVKFFHPADVPMPLFFLSGVLFWSFIGLLIDLLIRKIKKMKKH